MVRTMANSSLLVHSYMDAFGSCRQLGHETLLKHGITETAEWCPMDAINSSLNFTEEKIGKHTVRQIGRNISKHIKPKQRISDANDFIDYINGIYARNHLNLSGGFQIRRETIGYIMRFDHNPYPFTFNFGLIEGFLMNLHLFYDLQAAQQEQELYILTDPGDSACPEKNKRSKPESESSILQSPSSWRKGTIL